MSGWSLLQPDKIAVVKRDIRKDMRKRPGEHLGTNWTKPNVSLEPTTQSRIHGIHPVRFDR